MSFKIKKVKHDVGMNHRKFYYNIVTIQPATIAPFP